MDYSYAYTHSKIVFYFKQSPRDFVVEEIPLYSFDGEGAHWIVKVRKKNLTTFELINFLSTGTFLFPSCIVVEKLNIFSTDPLAVQYSLFFSS